MTPNKLDIRLDNPPVALSVELACADVEPEAREVGKAGSTMLPLPLGLLDWTDKLPVPAEDEGELCVMLDGAEPLVDAVETDEPDPLDAPEPPETEPLDAEPVEGAVPIGVPDPLGVPNPLVVPDPLVMPEAPKIEPLDAVPVEGLVPLGVPVPMGLPDPFVVPDPLVVPNPLRLGATEGKVPCGTPTTLLATDCPTLAAADIIDATEESGDAGAFVRPGTDVALGEFEFERIPEGPKVIPVPVTAVATDAVADEAGAAEALGDTMINGMTPPDAAD